MQINKQKTEMGMEIGRKKLLSLRSIVSIILLR
jgi:hypothetical protein